MGDDMNEASSKWCSMLNDIDVDNFNTNGDT